MLSLKPLNILYIYTQLSCLSPKIFVFRFYVLVETVASYIQTVPNIPL